ncbi:MAG: translation initiation factor IF-2 [Chloroflexia bacterium]
MPDKKTLDPDGEPTGTPRAQGGGSAPGGADDSEETPNTPTPRGRAPRPAGPPPGARPAGPGSRPGGGNFGGNRPGGGPGARPGGNFGFRPGGGNFGGSRPGGPGARPGGFGGNRPGGNRPGGFGSRPGGFGGNRPGGFGGSRPGTATGPRSSGVDRRLTPLVLPKVMSVKELAEGMGLGAAAVVAELMKNGVMATINQQIDYETAAVVATDLGFTTEEAKPELDAAEEQLAAELSPDNDPQAVLRPPVVTIMGHVDHGKTKLLDAIRSTNVVATEAGGITQHIGAYQVEVQGKKISFLDTPGHEAFTAMRARGAQVTDIAVLVVAADDGVMPQTIEAMNHAKAANVPIIVAINKVDKEDANAERVMTQLSEYNLVPVEWGGETEYVPVSAKTGLNISKLLEVILVVAELRDLKANPHRQALGAVIEAERDKARGPIATVLVQNGTLNLRDYVVAGSVWGRIRAMHDYKGRALRKAEPATPVEIQGLGDVPMAGDVFQVVPDEKTAREVSEKRSHQQRLNSLLQQTRPLTLEDMFSHTSAGKVKELRLILKADVRGSLEAIRQSLTTLNTADVQIKVLHEGTGGIGESDVSLAVASGAIIVGFNVRPDVPGKRAAEAAHVDVRFYNVIYNLVDDIKAAMLGMLDPTYKDQTEGYATVREVYRLPHNEQAAGLIVSDGKITRTGTVRVLRNGAVVHEGGVKALKRFKDDVRDVAAGYECGLSLEAFNDFQVGDSLEFYHKERVS